jgi:hypothetical protein
MEQTYTYAGKKITFDLEQYLSQSKGIKRIDMPQLNMEYVLELMPMFKDFVSVAKIELPVSQLKPTQCEINLDKVLMNIAKDSELGDLTFICSNDLHIIDGHHRHVHSLITDPTKMVTCYVFDIDMDELFTLFKSFSDVLEPNKDINESIIVQWKTILEDYGMQGPEASPGMGSVELGQPKTAETNGIKGSGDIPGGMNISKNKRDNEDEEDDINESKFNNLLAKFGAKIKDVDGKKFMSVQINKEGEHVNWQPLNEDKTPNNNKPLKLHFAKTEDENILPKLSQCVNLPIIRKCAKIDEPFSCETMEGITHGKAGDYLMIGVDGELYPCDADIFHKTYQMVSSDEEIRTDENGVAILRTDITETFYFKSAGKKQV